MTPDHHHRDHLFVRCGVITLSDTRTENTDESGTLIQQALKLEKHELSQIIGGYFNKNFYDLLNYYRIQKVCDQLLKVENRKFNLFGVALNCGYSSKSTFNAAFKKVKGVTPSQFVSKF